jgi:hypothetical protein
MWMLDLLPELSKHWISMYTGVACGDFSKIHECACPALSAVHQTNFEGV